VTKDIPLTTKQKGYLEGILQGLSGVKACMAAGYKDLNNNLANMAHTNSRNQYIKIELVKRRAEIEIKTDVTVELQQKEHTRLAIKAEAADDLATATRNIELRGKTIGAYIDKSINLNADLGRRPPDTKEAIERSRKRIESISRDNKDT
jgi:hypothetical protein